MSKLGRSGLPSQIIRFTVSSGMSAALSFVLPITLHELGGIGERVAVAIGFASAYLFNFLMLRLFVFRSRNSLRADALRYLPTNGAFRLAEYSAFLALNLLLSVNYALAVFIVLAVSTVLKFFGYRRVFGGRRPV